MNNVFVFFAIQNNLFHPDVGAVLPEAVPTEDVSQMKTHAFNTRRPNCFSVDFVRGNVIVKVN